MDRPDSVCPEPCQLFEGCGVAEELMMQTIARIFDRRLVEALDPNVKVISIADKIAIKECGLAHLEMAMMSEVFTEQMGLVTGANEMFARDDMRKQMCKSTICARSGRPSSVTCSRLMPGA